MSIRSFFKPRALYLAALLVLTLAFVTGTVYAAFFVIDTNDNVVTEWANQSIPVFVTDIAGDHLTTIGPTFDIINTWAARGTDKLYFRLQTSASPAIQDTRTTGNSANVAVAYLDCDNNGTDNTHADRVIGYISPQANPTACAPDKVIMADPADLDTWTVLGNPTPDATFGQRPSNAEDNIEWSVPMAALNATSPWPGAMACNGQIRIRFATWNMPQCAPQNGVAQDSTSARAFDVPTSVELISFVDGRAQFSPWFLGGMGALALLLAGLVLLGRKYNGFRA